MESSRTDFEVLGLKGQFLGLGLGLEASSPRKLACPRLEDSTIFWIKILWSGWKIFWKTFFCGDRSKNFCDDLLFIYLFFRSLEKLLWRPFCFFESTCACVLGPWPRAFLSLASRGSVLGKAVLGLGFVLCPWPWPRALCPRLHFWLVVTSSNCYKHGIFSSECPLKSLLVSEGLWPWSSWTGCNGFGLPQVL